ncbi:MAG: penicillin-binding protein activator [Ectothiorhodospiraceae bacterium]|nr:penicillin-binding protein activator [Ectothiorhodospiraceae bacterium]
MPQATPYRLYRIIAILALAALLGACAVRPPEPELPEEVESAREAVREGELEIAARLYLQAADREEEPERSLYRLYAADLYVQQADAERAREILDQVLTEEQPRQIDDWHAAVRAGLHLLDDAPEEALSIVDERLPSESDAVARLLIVRADSQRMMGQLFDSAETRVSLDHLLVEGQPQLENRLAIWESLSQVPMKQLREIMPPPPDTYGAWIELAFLIRSQHLDPPALEDSLRLWRQRYPDHPADERLVDRFIAEQQDTGRYPRHIAVLLPLSGPLADAGRAIRDGMLAGYFSHDGNRPELRFHDVGENGPDPWASYLQAVQDGAELVIGPLSRDSVEIFAGERALPVPVLALNGVRSTMRPPSGLYRFGLLPEDDARSAARRAYAAGHRHAVVLTPSNDWGRRVASAFREAFEEAGGVVLTGDTYAPDARDFAGPIRRVLELDLSDQRERRLRRTIGRSVEFEPRRRQDVDLVFLGAFPEQARLLRPQLRFHHAMALPVIATSHVYGGELNDADRDLSGVLFTDTPWTLGLPVPTPGQRDLEQALNLDPRSGSGGLHALGLDAYRLIPYLASMRADGSLQLEGATGMLSIDGSGQVHRDLPLARIRGRNVELMEPNREN